MTNKMSKESVKALVAEFFTKGTFNPDECDIRECDYHYTAGSYAHEVMDNIYMYVNYIGRESWDIYNDTTKKWYSLHYSDSLYGTQFYLFDCEVQSSNEYESTQMMIIAPTKRVAELEAKYSLLDSKWGPREVLSVKCIAKLDEEHIPASWKL